MDDLAKDFTPSIHFGRPKRSFAHIRKNANDPNHKYYRWYCDGLIREFFKNQVLLYPYCFEAQYRFALQYGNTRKGRERVMALTIQQRDVEGIIIFDVQGRIMAGESAGTLRETVHKQADSLNRNVILNLKSVDYIDSSGLGTLVAAHSTLNKAGGGLALLNLSKRSAELLVLTKLSTVFKIFDDEKSAVDSFFPHREVKRFDILQFVKGSNQ